MIEIAVKLQNLKKYIILFLLVSAQRPLKGWELKNFLIRTHVIEPER